VTGALSITLDNDRSEIARLGRLAEEFGEGQGLTPSLIFSVALALDEIVTNVIRYAFDDRERHAILVGLALEGGQLTASVEDDGRAFDPLSVPPPDIEAAIEDRPVGGLGLHLVRSLMDSVEYRRENGRNIFVMRKAVAGEPAP
jgi:anti-sigma regulatory factor (Ser/Thr protein kinase)